MENASGGAVARLKREAAARAVDEVTSGMVLGLGTGSTVAHFLELLAEALDQGRLEDIRGVPTSERTAAHCRKLGINLTDLERDPELDLAVDGADEIDPGVNLIKGLGGALLREKIVARAAARFVVIGDESKLVGQLGSRAPVPVEVVPFGWTVHLAFLRSLGAVPELRRGPDGEPYVTDNGNYILDAHFQEGLEDPEALNVALSARTGVVESGLFLEVAQVAYVATGEGIRVLERP